MQILTLKINILSIILKPFNLWTVFAILSSQYEFHEAIFLALATAFVLFSCGPKTTGNKGLFQKMPMN